jgi:GR25 family glycosyltransferase involved in LPS biosynthesis
LYINMDKSHERRKLMEDQLRVLASRETEVRRVRGVKYDAQTRPLTHSNTLRNSERGVIQAHYDAIQMALDEQVPFAMILEDDASFHLSKAWPESIRSLVARAPAGWDVIRLYGFQSLAFANCGHSVQFQQPALDVHSAAAYLISRQGMLKVQQGTDNFQSTFLHRSEPIDFSVVNTRKEMNNYILDKLYIAPFTHTASTLQDSINARWQLHCIDAALRHFVFRDPWMPVSKLNFQPK